jgi:hypothetical protein
MSTEKKLQYIIDLMQRDDSRDAPTDAVRWAKNLFRTRASQPKESFIKKLVAVVQMEIAPNKPAFGERSAAASSIRQVLYRAGDSAIDVRIEPDKKGFILQGQILGPDFSGATVVLSEDARSFKTKTVANEAGEFRFDSVPGGRYELTIRKQGVEITLKTVDVE